LHAEVGKDTGVQACHELLASTKRASNFGEVSSIEVTTALKLVLKFNTCISTSLLPPGVEIVTLLQSKEPDKGANNNDTDGIYEESIIENHEAKRDMVLLDDSCDGNRKCDQKCNS